MTKDETLKLALEAFRQIDEAMPFPVAKLAQKAIREALAQPEQEPVAVVTGTYGGRFTVKPVNPAMVLPLNMALYTTPPQRTWQGLTYEEAVQIIESFYGDEVDMLRSLEAKLKQKNGYAEEKNT